MTPVSPITSEYGLLNNLVGDSDAISQRLSSLNQQAASGLISDTYAGLGSGTSVSLSLNPVIAHQQALQQGINVATGTMQIAQGAMSQINQIASSLFAQLNTLNGLDSQSVDTTAASARSALQQVANLLDTTDGNTYVFGGQDTANPPVPNPDDITTSGFFSQISAAVSGLGSDSSTVASATLAVASSDAPGTSPFSATLSQPASSIPQATVETGEGRSQVGLVASANTFVASTGSSTTGSYMRDVLRALATIGSLNSSQVNAGGFQGLIQDTRTSLGGAITAMGEDVGVLGNQQAQLTTIGTQLSDTTTTLTNQVSSAEDVNMASTLSQITQTQTQLQASYELISSTSSLSLVKYLASA